jgi:hypothetical protein
MAYVYRHIRLDKNEPFYIGIGISDKNGYKRAFTKLGRNSIWEKIIKKSEYDIEIIFDNVSPEFAKKKEIEFISMYGRIDLCTGTLCNMTDGGDGTLNMIYSNEYKKKLSDKAKQRVISLEQRVKIGISHRGHKWTEQQKENLRLIKNSKKIVKTTKQIEFSKHNMQTNNPSKGRLGVNSINFKGYISAYDTHNHLVDIFEGVHDAARKLNLIPSKISAVLNGKRNHTGGYNFLYKGKIL